MYSRKIRNQGDIAMARIRKPKYALVWTPEERKKRIAEKAIRSREAAKNNKRKRS